MSRGGFGGRGGGYGGRGGGGGGFRGGRGGYGAPEGPPDTVKEVGVFLHTCESELVCKSTQPMIPYFNAPIYLENKQKIGKLEEILGPINEVFFTVKLDPGMNASSFQEDAKFFIDPLKLLPQSRFLPPPPGSRPPSRGGARGGPRGGARGGRGGFGGGGFGGRGGGSRGGPPGGRGAFGGRGSSRGSFLRGGGRGNGPRGRPSY